jgi:hypothetical protein
MKKKRKRFNRDVSVPLSGVEAALSTPSVPVGTSAEVTLTGVQTGRGSGAKTAKKERRYRDILIVEALLRERGKTSKQTFPNLWKERHNERPPSEATRERARAWDRSRRTR